MADSYFIVINEDGSVKSIPENDLLNEVVKIPDLIGGTGMYAIECDNDLVRNDICFYSKFESFPNSVIIVPAGGEFKMNWFASHIVKDANKETNEAGLRGIYGNVIMCKHSIMPNKNIYFSGYTKEVADIICERAKSYYETAKEILTEKFEN